MALLTEVARRWMPRRQSNGLYRLRCRVFRLRDEEVERGDRLELVVGNWGLRGGGGLGGLVGHLVAEERSPGKDAVGYVTPVTGGTDELPDAHEVQAGLPLGVRILDELDLGFGNKAWHFGQGDEVVEVLPLMLEVEARVLEGGGEVNQGLPDFMDLLCRRDLQVIGVRQRAL